VQHPSALGADAFASRDATASTKGKAAVYEVAALIGRSLQRDEEVERAAGQEEQHK